MSKRKIFQYLYLVIILIGILILSLININVSAATYTLINDSMTADEVLTAIGKSPNSYSSFDNTLENLYSSSADEDEYVALLKDFNTCYEFVGIGEGLDSYEDEYVSTYLVLKSKLTFEEEPYYSSLSTMNFWCGSSEDNSIQNYKIDFLTSDTTLYDKTDYILGGTCGLISSNNDSSSVSKGIVIYKIKMYSSDLINKSHQVAIENVSLGSDYTTLSFVQTYTYDEDTGDLIVDKNDDPKYMYCETSTDGENIIFYFNHSSTVEVESVQIENVNYEVTQLFYDELTSTGEYETTNFDLSYYGTKTYTLTGYTSNNQFYDISSDNVTFRYVFSKTSVWVEAECLIEYTWLPFGGYSTFVYFNLIEKETGKEIDNAIDVQCKYYYKNVLYTPIQSVASATFSNVTGASLGLMFNTLDENGKLFVRDSSHDYLYVWDFDNKISGYDVVYIHYEVEGQIITGSCYENGLHVETDSEGNKAVYDMNGVLQTDYTISDNDLIADSEGDLIETTNPDPIVVDDSSSLSNVISKIISCALIILLIIGIVMLCPSVLPMIISIVIKVIILPFKLLSKIINAFKNKGK